MKITGKKIVTLSAEEKAALKMAEDILDILSETLDDQYYDFSELSSALFHIRTTDKFETEFDQ